MILSDDERRVVDRTWDQPNGVAVYDLTTGKTRVASLGGVECGEETFALVQGRGDCFARRFDAKGCCGVAAYAIDDFTKPLARIAVRSGKAEFSGDAAVWSRLPGAYHGLLFDVLLVDGADRRAKWHGLQNFARDFGSYDAYISGVAELPGSTLLFVTAAKYPKAFIYDPGKAVVVKEIDVTNGLSNPRVLGRAGEVWAADYDTVLRVDVKSGRVKQRVRLQGAVGVHSAWVGEFAFSRDEELCVVARPYCNDVVGLETESMRICWRAAFPGAPKNTTARSRLTFFPGEGWLPSRVRVLSDNRTVIARDHLSGEFIRGKLEPIKD